MSIDNLKEIVKQKILEDFKKCQNLEQEYQKEISKMEQIGLSNSNGYVSLIAKRLTVSYFTAYLYRIIKFIKGADLEVITNISRNEMRLKRNIQMWKKNDIKKVRKMRKQIGEDGVSLMKKSINESILKIDEYVDSLGEGIRKM